MQQYGPWLFAATEHLLPDFSLYYAMLEAIPASTLPIYWTVPVFGYVQQNIQYVPSWAISLSSMVCVSFSEISRYALPCVGVVAALCFLWSTVEKFFIEEEVYAFPFGINSRMQLPAGLPAKLKVKSVEAVWPTRQDSEEHGLRLIVHATKPARTY